LINQLLLAESLESDRNNRDFQKASI